MCNSTTPAQDNNYSQEMKEYLEQEGISQDDIIDKEIEEEHAAKNKRIDIQKMSKEASDEMYKNLKDPNLFAMEVSFAIDTINFVDMKEFNSQKFTPLEIDKKRKEYVQNKLADLMLDTTEKMHKLVEENGFILTYSSEQAFPFNKAAYTSKSKIARLLNKLDI